MCIKSRVKSLENFTLGVRSTQREIGIGEEEEESGNELLNMEKIILYT